jgi:hypothetical protein
MELHVDVGLRWIVHKFICFDWKKTHTKMVLMLIEGIKITHGFYKF